MAGSLVGAHATTITNFCKNSIWKYFQKEIFQLSKLELKYTSVNLPLSVNLMEIPLDSNQTGQHGEYEYCIASYRKSDGMYQGLILLTAHAGIQFSPIIEIPTPSVFKADRAARIEASALACQLIETGAMTALVPKDGKTSSWPVESAPSL